MKKSVKRRAKEAMEKYKPTVEKANDNQNSNLFPNKNAPSQSSGYIPKPEKKRG
ncbi:MAG: hypothetical protein H7Z37_16815 [Pyrinomonadaceae bacterium]|nr:hypothetical protein [Pyrinomonadaceae bacterium]